MHAHMIMHMTGSVAARLRGSSLLVPQDTYLANQVILIEGLST